MCMTGKPAQSVPVRYHMEGWSGNRYRKRPATKGVAIVAQSTMFSMFERCDLRSNMFKAEPRKPERAPAMVSC
jgi:hypothetical protein